MYSNNATDGCDEERGFEEIIWPLNVCLGWASIDCDANSVTQNIYLDEDCTTMYSSLTIDDGCTHVQDATLNLDEWINIDIKDCGPVLGDENSARGINLFYVVMIVVICLWR